ncbi:hypothetical protein AMTR_s00032p00078320 [Amborella trichopoda]|uniref:Uncharacterized protein n=1 Tax=Amborella trichopoda TaxID=13333 RepID=U5CNR9_AMBTC|nr:hypothetical protein AMTR_s00032p00078320 [Amborella trichopoda]
MSKAVNGSARFSKWDQWGLWDANETLPVQARANISMTFHVCMELDLKFYGPDQAWALILGLIGPQLGHSSGPCWPKVQPTYKPSQFLSYLTLLASYHNSKVVALEIALFVLGGSNYRNFMVVRGFQP